VGVGDGDTVTVRAQGRTLKIRLEGIDCPELGQDFGRRAKQFTSDMVFAKEVSVEPRGTDSYGRTVARVFSGKKDLGLELLNRGLAWHYRRYSSDRVLAEAERQARRARVGLWSAKDPTPPWEWRRRQRGAQDR
jgi:endonuclease YncB( thermonuclease family)